jgi:hypothetical protein
MTRLSNSNPQFVVLEDSKMASSTVVVVSITKPAVRCRSFVRTITKSALYTALATLFVALVVNTTMLIVFTFDTMDGQIDNTNTVSLPVNPKTTTTAAAGGSSRSRSSSSSTTSTTTNTTNNITFRSDDGYDSRSNSTTTTFRRQHHQPPPPPSSLSSTTPFLNCDAHGGPSNELAQEMVYWQDIPSDYDFRSPFLFSKNSITTPPTTTNGPIMNHTTTSSSTTTTRYLTVEPDNAGFNNYRMSLEVNILLAAVTGRVLVIPPARKVSHFDETVKYSFTDFFDLHRIATKFHHTPFDIIPYSDFRKQHRIVEISTEQNIDNGHHTAHTKTIDLGRIPGRRIPVPVADDAINVDSWLRTHIESPDWGSEYCLLVIPQNGLSTTDPTSITEYNTVQYPTIQHYLDTTRLISERNRSTKRGNPIPVDSSPEKRMGEILGTRKRVCLYDGTVQSKQAIHLRCEGGTKGRILAPFYTVLFFEDWKVSLWSKRFIRDNVRYKDQIQCAAARIVAQMRTYARASPQNDGTTRGDYYSMHIRRRDMIPSYQSFVPELTEDAKYIYSIVSTMIPPNQTIYISTDEEDHTFFDYFREQGHSIYFLSDFLPHTPPHPNGHGNGHDKTNDGGNDNNDKFYYLRDLHRDYHGLVEQLVASRGRVFVGCYYSTFTAYINRLRGYHSQKEKSGGWEDGIINSFYYAPKAFRTIHSNYTMAQHTLWAQEYPTGWRDIDQGYLPWTDRVIQGKR